MAERPCGGEISLHIQRRMKVIAVNCVHRRACIARPIGDDQAADQYDQAQASVDRQKPTQSRHKFDASMPFPVSMFGKTTGDGEA